MIFSTLLMIGCTSPSTNQNAVLLLVIDGVRADRLGAYGHNPTETPHMDKLAKEGTKFTRAYATSTTAQSAYMSLVLGLSPQAHGHRIQTTSTDPAVLNNSAGFLSQLDSKGRDWGVLDWDQGADNFAGIEGWSSQHGAKDFLIVRLPPMAEGQSSQLSPLEYDAALKSYDSTVGRVLEEWERYRPDGFVVLSGVNGSLAGARNDAALALTDDLLRVPVVIKGPGVEQDWAVDDVVSAIDVAVTASDFLDASFDGHGKNLLSGGSERAYHESTYGYVRFLAHPVVGYTEKDGRYEEGVFGRMYPSSGLDVKPFQVPVSEHPLEAKQLLEMRQSFGPEHGLPDAVWDIKVDALDCVGLDTLAIKIDTALTRKRMGPAKRMMNRLKELAPQAPILAKLNARLLSVESQQPK